MSRIRWIVGQNGHRYGIAEHAMTDFPARWNAYNLQAPILDHIGDPRMTQKSFELLRLHARLRESLEWVRLAWCTRHISKGAHQHALAVTRIVKGWRDELKALEKAMERMTTREHLRAETQRVVSEWLATNPHAAAEIRAALDDDRVLFDLVSECLLRMESEDVLLPEGFEYYIDAAFELAALRMGLE